MIGSTASTHDTGPATETACRTTRVRIMLTLGRSFTPAQVADLMVRSYRAGLSEAGEFAHADTAEQIATWADHPVVRLTQAERYERRLRRIEHDDAMYRLRRGLPERVDRGGIGAVLDTEAEVWA